MKSHSTLRRTAKVEPTNSKYGQGFGKIGMLSHYWWDGETGCSENSLAVPHGVNHSFYVTQLLSPMNVPRGSENTCSYKICTRMHIASFTQAKRKSRNNRHVHSRWTSVKWGLTVQWHAHQLGEGMKHRHRLQLEWTLKTSWMEEARCQRTNMVRFH